ncbi:LCP family protein [Pseudonocardia sp. GCM10023141]|uniref:LCP family protein n=1 Tax=Pseudonocardia sp. GCM10023141 TaxID=3252653 RepID=UPI003620734E
MEDESIDDVLARHGLLRPGQTTPDPSRPARTPVSGGRAARRRAAELADEAAEAAARSAPPEPPRRSGRPDPAVPPRAARPRATGGRHPGPPPSTPPAAPPPPPPVAPPGSQAGSRGSSRAAQPGPVRGDTRRPPGPDAPARNGNGGRPPQGRPAPPRSAPARAPLPPLSEPPIPSSLPPPPPPPPLLRPPSSSGDAESRRVPPRPPIGGPGAAGSPPPTRGRTGPRPTGGGFAGGRTANGPTTGPERAPGGRAAAARPAAGPTEARQEGGARALPGARPGPAADLGSGVPDISERAERSRRDERSDSDDIRASRIDETLVRLTAAHAGLVLGADPDDEDVDAKPRFSLRDLPRPSLGQLLLVALALVVFLTSATGWVTRGWLSSSVRHVAALDTGSGAIVDGAAQKGDQNVLVVATDPPAPAGTTQQDTPPGTSAGADTVSVVHVPAGNGPVVVLSIPAGLETTRPPCPRYDPISGSYTNETQSAETRTQLTSALDVGGPRCVTRVVQQLTGLAITGYIGVSLDKVSPLVAAVGGIPLCLARPVQDSVLGPVAPSAGRQNLDSQHTDDFVHAGSVAGDPSPDYGRLERQQQVLSAVFDGALSTTGLLDLGQVSALRTAIAGGIVADGIGIDGIAGVARTLHRLDADGVTFTSVPTSPELNGRGNTMLRDADAATLFSAIRRHVALPAAVAGPAATAAGPKPGDMKVQVLNASDTPGRAAQIGDTLRSLGFGIGDVSNAPQPTTQTVIKFSPDQAAAAGLLASSVPAATSIPDPGANGVLQLILGRSFDDVVKPPVQAQPAGGAATAPPPAHVAACS